MKISIKVGLSLAALWIAAKLAIYLLGMSIEWYNMSAMINNFLLLSSVGIGLYLTKRNQGFTVLSYLDDVKAAISGGIVYTLIVASFSWYYLEKIDGSYLDYRIEERMILVEESLSDDARLEEYKLANTQSELQSRDEIIAEIRQTTEGVLNPKVQFVFLLMGFMLLTVIYALLIAFFFKKILLKGL